MKKENEIIILPHLATKHPSLPNLLREIMYELIDAEKKFPDFPSNKTIGAAIVCEEAGELIKACLEFENENKDGKIKGRTEAEYKDIIREEAIQTAAMAMRFLLNFNLE